ncbi:MAG: hypothetical protein EBT83_17560 [Betaproteobacteria bacterium]|nr:hypothetical protein [Betaproteobacteria bacterium]
MNAPDDFPERPTDWHFEDAPLLVKDLLRDLKSELKRFDPARILNETATPLASVPLPLPITLPLSPFRLAAELVRETRRAAQFGSSLARDLIDPHREDGLSALAAGRQIDRSRYVRARYQAARHILNRWGATDVELRERPLAQIWARLPSAHDDERHDTACDELAAAACRLAASGAVTSQSDPRLAFRVFAAMALAEAMITLSHAESDLRDDPASLIGALDLAADVVSLRRTTFDSMMNGFDPATALSHALRSLAPHLTKG